MDLTQEVFVIAWRRRADVPDHALPWLYQVARRLLANQWRSRRVTPAMLPLLTEQVADRPAGGVDRLEDVRLAMATLSDADQEILHLIGWEGLTVPEAAIVLGCRRATAAVRLHRARRRLERALESAPNRD